MTAGDGSIIKVEDVELGNILKGSNGKQNKVVEVQTKILGERKLVSINGSDFFCTEDHPFKTEDGWKAVNSAMSMEKYPYLTVLADLVVGDKIETQDGSVTVEKIDTKKDLPETKLWNF